jgi:hypothetical protein
VAAIAAAVIYVSPLSGQEIPNRRGLDASAATLEDVSWTAVTMAPNGSWGVATEPTVGKALASAISNCRVMSKGEIGCGAQARTIRAGWIVGLRCGDTNIIAAERLLPDAEQAARKREVELKQFYAPDIPACSLILTAGPGGAGGRAS